MTWWWEKVTQFWVQNKKTNSSLYPALVRFSAEVCAECGETRFLKED